MYEIEDIKNSIIVGNVLETIKEIPDESIDCVITSPPYWGQRNYGTLQWLNSNNPECDHEAARIKTRYDYSMGEMQRAYDNADAKVYKDKCPECGADKVDFQIGNEPHYNMYIKKMIDLFSEVKRILTPEGSIWLNVGETYAGNQLNTISRIKDIPKKSQMQLPARLSIAFTDELGLILRNTIIWFKPNPFVSSDPTKFTNDFEYFYWFVKNPKYYFVQQKEPLAASSIKRADYGWHGKKLLDGKSWNGLSETDKMGTRFAPTDGRNKRTVWKIPTAGSEGRKSGAHVAPFPEKLIETPIKATCPPDGIVFDPFIGSGTTGALARRLGRTWVGCDLNPDYAKFAIERINKLPVQLELL